MKSPKLVGNKGENKEKKPVKRNRKPRVLMSTKVTPEEDKSTEKPTVPVEPKSLADMGYKIDDGGHLVTISESPQPFKFIDQKHYEKLGDFVSSEIQRRAVAAGLVEQWLPHGESDPSKQVNVFTTPNVQTSDKPLIVVICGSGYVVAGQWARSLCINQGLGDGSALPDFSEALARGWELVVMNPNKRVPAIPMPERHADAVWREFVSPSKSRAIGIFCHSFGGSLTVHLIEEGEAKKDISRIKAVAMTDSVHSTPETRSGRAFFKEERCRCWYSSKEPLDTDLGRKAGIHAVSAGHEKHEHTTYSARPSVWKFFDKWMLS